MNKKVEVFPLGPDEWERLRAIRIRALIENPEAFGAALVEVEAQSREAWLKLFEKEDYLVASINSVDVGMLYIEVLKGDHGATCWIGGCWTDHARINRWSADQILRHMFRLRVLIYTGILLIIVSIFFGALFTRIPVKMDVIRDRGSMGREVEEGMIENVYRLQIMNTDESAHRYHISVSGIETIQLQGSGGFSLQATESKAVPVNVRLGPGQGVKGSNTMWFTLVDIDNPDVQLKEKAVFFVPR